MAIDQGSVLAGRFAVGEVLGRGGMADVYRGEDQVLGRQVAIKVFRGVEGSDSEKARFEAEGRVLAGLSHPGLVTLLDVGTDADREFLVMELVDGPTLSTRLGEPMPEAEVADLARQVAHALAYAHGQGVIHRDVKPGNILLGKDGRVKIADFGIARLVDQATRHTQDGMAIGSPAYLAPEQVTGTGVTEAADVWSLGLVLLEALTGKREYVGSSTEVAMARLHRAPEVPDELPHGWPSLLRAMTAPEPGDRPTAAEVAAAIPEPGTPGDTALLTQAVPPGADPESTQPWAPAGAGAAGATVTEHDEHHREGRSPRWMVIAGAVAAALLVAIVVLALLDGGDETSPGETEREIPDGVPTRLEQPLTDLHDAIHGSQQ